MSKFGNILILYDCTDDQMEQAEVIIMSFNALWRAVGNALFFQTTDKMVTRTILNQVEALGVKFTVFHNQVPTGSYFRTGQIDADTERTIEEILGV